MRIHRSAIANLAQVQSMYRDDGRWRLILNSGETLPISRTRLAALREALDETELVLAAE